MKSVTYWYQFFTAREELVPILHDVKFTKCEICGSTGHVLISCRMMHNLIKRVVSYFTDRLRGANRWMDGLMQHYVHTCGSCNTV